MQRLNGNTQFCHTRTHSLWSWASQGGVVGSCQQFGWKAASIHQDSGAVNQCRSIGLVDFQFQFTPVRCVQLQQLFTPYVQAASIECLNNPQCTRFARNARTGDTLLCTHVVAAESESETVSRLTAVADDPWNHDGGLELSHWLFACRRGTCSVGELGEPADMLYTYDHLAERMSAKRVLEGFNVVSGHAVCPSKNLVAWSDESRAGTHSVLHAAFLCAAEPHCTMFARVNETGQTWFCQGYQRIHESNPPYNFQTGFRHGCEHYTENPSSADIGLSRTPSCHNGTRVCTEGLYRLPMAIRSTRILPEPLLCDECGDYGACPVLPPSAQPLAIDPAASSSLLNTAAMRAVAPHPGGGINPCLFTHQNATLVVYRATTALRCTANSIDGEFALDFPQLREQNSLVGICTLRRPVGCPTCSLTPVDCTTWPAILEIENLDERVMTVDRHDFVGIEDPRGFSFQGVAYVIANTGMRVKPWNPQVRQRYGDLRKRRTLLVALDSARRPARTLMITLPSTVPTLDDKNVVPLLSPDAKSVYLVYSFVPYGLCKLDLGTGGCEQVKLKDTLGAPGGPESKVGSLQRTPEALVRASAREKDEKAPLSIVKPTDRFRARFGRWRWLRTGTCGAARR